MGKNVKTLDFSWWLHIIRKRWQDLRSLTSFLEKTLNTQLRT